MYRFICVYKHVFNILVFLNVKVSVIYGVTKVHELDYITSRKETWPNLRQKRVPHSVANFSASLSLLIKYLFVFIL